MLASTIMNYVCIMIIHNALNISMTQKLWKYMKIFDDTSKLIGDIHIDCSLKLMNLLIIIPKNILLNFMLSGCHIMLGRQSQFSTGMRHISFFEV